MKASSYDYRFVSFHQNQGVSISPQTADHENGNPFSLSITESEFVTSSISSTELSVNGTSTDSWDWTWQMTAKTLVFSPIIIFAVFGNFLVLYAFVKGKNDLRSPTHFIIANLSFADFLVGILALPFLATQHITGRWYFGANFCYAWVIIHFWLCSGSILSTLAVCIERYLGVKYPLRHFRMNSSIWLTVMISCVWGVAGFLSIVSVLAFPEPGVPEELKRFECRGNKQLGHVLINTIGILYIPTSLMVFLYWRIYVIATAHLKKVKGWRDGGNEKGAHPPNVERPQNLRPGSKIKSRSKLFQSTDTPSTTGEYNTYSTSIPESKASSNSAESNKFTNGGHLLFISASDPLDRPKAEIAIISKPILTAPPTTIPISQSPRASFDLSRAQINLAKRLSFLVGIVICSYIPFYTAFLVRSAQGRGINDPLVIVLEWIRCSNSALNPVIYAFAVPGYRKAFKNILTGWRK